MDLTHSIYNPLEESKTTAQLPVYSGKVLITFKAHLSAAQLSNEFFLDFAEQGAGVLKSVKINKTDVQPRWDKKDDKIYLPSSLLKLGQVNSVEIEFINNFTRNGKGFHRALDLQDNEAYVFTNLEPYYANEVFPLFDQPDLKATYLLQTEVPSHWEVISNTREINKEQLNSSTTKWTFEKSQKFSSYLFALVAGPFQVWTSNDQYHIPMRLFSRKTVANKVDATAWFDITKQTFDFYENHFGPYQFQKYDQIIVPEITSGAMENVAAVTFNESYLASGNIFTPVEKTKAASVIAHEMAHMWFGDLVTMKWWDDLWLNESFASFASALAGDALKNSLGLLDSWEHFFTIKKSWGYEEDNYSTTHPIVAKNVESTDAAQSIFDGISYGKGASVLKQLYYYTGKDNFFNGVKNYLDTFAFQNATRNDFINALSNSSGINLSAWDQEWLQTSGTNSLKLSVTTEVVKGLHRTHIVLTPVPDSIEQKFRTHRTQLGFYGYNSDGRVALITKTTPITYSNQSVVLDTHLGQDPIFVTANAFDYDFVKEIYDANTIFKLKKHLVNFEDGLLKQQIYFSLLNMVKNSELSAVEFFDIVLNSLKKEKNLNVINEATIYLKESLAYMPLSERLNYYNQIADHFKIMMDNELDETLKQAFFRKFLAFSNVNYTEFIFNTYANHIKMNIDFNQTDRWFMLQALAKNNFLNIEQLVENELKNDRSNNGRLQANVALIQIPTESNKRTWFNNLIAVGKIDTASARTISAYFHNICNPEITQFLEDEYFNMILSLLDKKVDSNKVAYLASALYPHDASEEFLEKTQKFIHTHSDNLPASVNRLMIQRYEDALKIKSSKKD